MTATRIYVIDDDEPTRRSLSYALEVSGYLVIDFASAAAFLDQWTNESTCILISDIRVPGLDGISLTRRLREMGASLPIILISGHTDDALRADAMRAGAAAVLDKPFELHVLIAAIEHALADSDR